MGFSNRCRYWFILQVVVAVVCYRGKVSCTTKTAQSCVGSRLDLRCSSTKVINIQIIYRGISSCTGATCCIRDAGCDQQLSEEYKRSVHNRCDDQQHCTVDISFVKFPCTSGWWWGKMTTDGYAYEKITYTCRDGPRYSTTATQSMADTTDEKILHTTEKFPKDEKMDDNVTSAYETHAEINANITEEDDKSDEGEAADQLDSWILPIIIVAACLIVVGAIIIPVSIKARRKRACIKKCKNQEPEGSGPKTCETPASDCSELERPEAGRIQAPCESAYESLGQGRNYEPMNFYEQLQ